MPEIFVRSSGKPAKKFQRRTSESPSQKVQELESIANTSGGNKATKKKAHPLFGSHFKQPAQTPSHSDILNQRGIMCESLYP